MGIRNTALGGGSNWADDEIMLAADMNATMNAAYDQLNKNTMFWLNASNRTIYDDGNTGSVIGSLWTVTGSAIYQNTNFAGGAGSEIKIGPTSGTSTHSILSSGLTANRSYHMNYWFVASGIAVSAGALSTSYGRLKFLINDSSDVTQSKEIVVHQASHHADAGTSSASRQWGDILVVNTAANTYDVYSGGSKICAGQTTQTGSLKVGFSIDGQWTLTTAVNSELHVDNVVYSKTSA